MQCKMSNNSISTYKFKPFEFTELKKNLDPQQRPLVRIGHPVVCNNAYLFTFGGYNTETNDVLGQRVSPTMHELWKYCFDLGEWKKIKCLNVPDELTSSPVRLNGNIITVHGCNRVPLSEFSGHRMYLGNLANEYEENGMSFEELEVSGDVPLPFYGQGVVMDGKYTYSIGGTTEMAVHRFDMDTRKWELLHKSVREGQDPKPRFKHEVVFYKGRIYLFGGGQNGIITARNIFYSFAGIHMFDVATKQWQLLLTKNDQRAPGPGYPNNRSWHSCVQCPEKSNLVYKCGGFDGYQSFKDVWRFDLDTLQWQKFINCIMPQPVYLHSTAITPSGRMYCYGGIVPQDDIDVAVRGSLSNDIITSAWVMIPKLKVMCWEAMIYYFKEQMLESSDEGLKKIGLPQEHYDRIIEARKT